MNRSNDGYGPNVGFTPLLTNKNVHHLHTVAMAFSVWCTQPTACVACVADVLCSLTACVGVLHGWDGGGGRLHNSIGPHQNAWTQKFWGILNPPDHRFSRPSEGSLSVANNPPPPQGVPWLRP